MNRSEIIQKIADEQQKVIENLQQSVERYKTASDLEENSAADPDELSRQTEAKDMQLRFEQMLSEAEQNLNFVDNEKTKSHTLIEKGSIVETDKNYLFIGISLHALQADGKEVISFSKEAPVYKVIQHKKVGETLEIGEDTFKIISIQ